MKGFLAWYKINGESLEQQPIITGLNPDTVKTGMRVVINMEAVDDYLQRFRQGGYVSEIFLHGIRNYYKEIADEYIKKPILDYEGSIPGLEADIIFGFEPEEILDHIKEAQFSKVSIVSHKALVKLTVSKYISYVISLTNNNGKWLIDYYGFTKPLR